MINENIQGWRSIDHDYIYVQAVMQEHFFPDIAGNFTLKIVFFEKSFLSQQNFCVDVVRSLAPLKVKSKALRITGKIQNFTAPFFFFAQLHTQRSNLSFFTNLVSLAFVRWDKRV